MATLEDRVREIETDVVESEDRQMAALADMKNELKAYLSYLNEGQKLIASVLLALLRPETLYTPTRNELIDSIKAHYRID